MSETLITETCQIVWWKGYVKGRFVALLESEVRPAEVVGESPPIRWRGSGEPEPTESAVQALDALTERLVDAGWTLREPREDAWFGLVLSRPAAAPVVPDAAEDPRPAVATGAVATSPDQAPVVERLHLELVRALDEIEHERQLRQEAEQQAGRQAAQQAARVAAPSAPPPPLPPQSSRGRRPVLTAVELASVVAASVVALLLFDSAYAAAVAALTAGGGAPGPHTPPPRRGGREVPPPPRNPPPG